VCNTHRSSFKHKTQANFQKGWSEKTQPARGTSATQHWYPPLPQLWKQLRFKRRGSTQIQVLLADQALESAAQYQAISNHHLTPSELRMAQSGWASAKATRFLLLHRGKSNYLSCEQRLHLACNFLGKSIWLYLTYI
jgi:hypothetical protein